MFDFVRNHSRLMLGLMVLLIFPSFVFFGIQGYSRFQDEAAAEVARVDGREINRSEWDAAHQRQVERLRQQMPGVDLKLFDTPEFRRQTLDAIIRERVLAAAADRQHLQPGDDRLKRLFVQDPQFANVRNPDNTVNKAILSAQGMSSEQFAQQLRREYALQQVTQGISQTGLAPQVLAGAGEHRIRGARPGGVEEGRGRARGRPAQVLHRERQPLHRGRRAPRPPHPGAGRQGRAGPTSSRRPRPRPRRCWPTRARTRPALPIWPRRIPTIPGLRRPTVATCRLLRPRRRWSSRSRMPPSR
jgi:hypothetical protein